MVGIDTNLDDGRLLIRSYAPSDSRKIISMIKRSDSTDRSELTWSANHMTGVLAYDGDELVGAIPFEPRNFALGNDEKIKVLWVSAAHVDPEYRSKGLGGQLDQLARKTFYPDYQGIFVYRGDENSLAYKWYIRLGYHVLLQILSLKIDVVHTNNNVSYHSYSTLEELKFIETEIYNCYQKNSGSYGGTPYRYKSCWSEKIYSHYYQKHYLFHTLVLSQDSNIESYAILGETKYKDGVKRFDILEYCCSDDDSQRERLVSAIMTEAHKKQLKEIRIQISNQDPGFRCFERLGFCFRRRTNLMGTLTKPMEYLTQYVKKCKELKNTLITIETPSLGKHDIGCGYNKFGLFMSDNEFIRVLLLRTNFMTAVEEGRILVTQNQDHSVLKIFESLFPQKKWLHHQIDYI
jgi:ribosomal protein S18 acetylase RimI-like enzyme